MTQTSEQTIHQKSVTLNTSLLVPSYQKSAEVVTPQKLVNVLQVSQKSVDKPSCKQYDVPHEFSSVSSHNSSHSSQTFKSSQSGKQSSHETADEVLDEDDVCICETINPQLTKEETLEEATNCVFSSIKCINPIIISRSISSNLVLLFGDMKLLVLAWAISALDMDILRKGETGHEKE